MTDDCKEEYLVGHQKLSAGNVLRNRQFKLSTKTMRTNLGPGGSDELAGPEFEPARLISSGASRGVRPDGNSKKA